MRGDRIAPVVAQLPQPEVDPDDARRVATEILSRPEYRVPEPSLLDRGWGWLQDQLARVLGALGGSGGGYWLGITLVVVALTVAVWLALRFLPRGRRRRAGVGPPVVATSSPGRLTRRDLLERAARAEGDGRWADAVADRYRALVLGLAELRRLPDDPAVTTGELRNLFQGGQEARSVFDRASTRFEHVRYRGDPAVPEDPEQLREFDRHLVGGRP